MRAMRAAIVLSGAVLAVTPATSGAWAFGGGGTAPGGPLSGSIRPVCNGFDMSGRPTSAACDGRSVDERRAAARRSDETR